MKKVLTIATILVSLTTYSGTLSHNSFPPSITDNSIQDEDNRDKIIINTDIDSNGSVSSVNIYESSQTDDLASYLEHHLVDNRPSPFDEFGFPILPTPPTTSWFVSYVSDIYTLLPNQSYTIVYFK